MSLETYTDEELAKIGLSKTFIPTHIAIIMDGNGRWAAKKGLPRTNGHAQGVKTAKKITNECVKLNIKFLTLYSFSMENWKRPKEEVDFLMNLCAEYLTNELPELMDKNVKLNHIGRLENLPTFVQEKLKHTIEQTKNNSHMTLTLALNYSGRVELEDAVKKIAYKVKNGTIDPSTITTQTISEHLYSPELPDPDLLIRTANECRLSNFLLWQSAYTEFYTDPTLWPDFDIENLHNAIKYYGTRERKFGGLNTKNGK